MKRAFDIFFSIGGLLVLSPLLAAAAIAVAATTPGGIFYRGYRVGRHGRSFKMFKFRTMYADADSKLKLNVAGDDERITPVGHFLRNTKINELPQLIDVLLGRMSFVGPRPEMQYYVDMYTEEEKRILDLKPGITDWASITHYDQYRAFTAAADPDEVYLQYIRPLKIRLQLYYRDHHSFLGDLKIIFWTLYKIFTRTEKLPEEIAPIVAQYHQETNI